ncbi:hypothetical protein MHU86_15925 [Fragilaria crotonensis]|nr:hypothetical protein MHU86_15925 [Fragilaria crotonensis]
MGLAETNTCWAHSHTRADLKATLRRYQRQSKISFGSPSNTIDPCPERETFQAGGNVTILTGSLTSSSTNQDVSDPTGLGRWCGISLTGKQEQKISIITAYRTCTGSPRTSPIGGTFIREYEYLVHTKQKSSNPRAAFFNDLQTVIRRLQEHGHFIILMMDANSTIDTDYRFQSFIESWQLYDLHEDDPAPSTYIGAESRRIDFIFGCKTIADYKTRAGTLSYSEGPQSDHRGLYVDILFMDLFSQTKNSINDMSRRALYTGNPALVETYNERMLQYYEQHDMVKRIDYLHEHQSSMTREEVRKMMIKWDNDQGRSMLSAEKYLSPPIKKCQWSPTLRNAAIQRRYWKLRLRELHYKEDYSHTFTRWQKQIQNHDASFCFPFLGVELQEAEIRKNLNKSNRIFRKHQRDSVPLRLKTYQDLLEQYEDDNNPATKKESSRKAKIVRQTMTGEVCRQTFGDIRKVIKPVTSASVHKLLIPRSKNSLEKISSEQSYKFLQEMDPQDLLWDTIIEREDIERYLLHYNRDSIKAAGESPCGHGVIHDSLTFSGLSPSASDLLMGEVPQEWAGRDDILMEFLAGFTIPSSVDTSGPIPTVISESEIIRGFKTWPESTSTSPSGRHLGHYKAIIQHPVLLTCFSKFMNIAVARGIAVPRWCHATNVLIEKDPGIPKLNRLRIIHLFEADLNFFLKIQWGHRLVRRAFDLDLIHKGQHGSVPTRTAIDPVMLTQLTTDLCRILKHNILRFDNDASACYDRIIVALGMLAAQRCGMPTNAIKIHSDVLRSMQYTVKTSHGVSEGNYQGTALEPLFGTGQGSGASPSVWLTLSMVMLNTLEKLVPERMTFKSFTGSRSHSRMVDAFVDDTSLCLTSPSGTSSLDELITRLQTIAQTWEHILYLSGGKLNLSKCSWYAMFWEWKNGRPSLQQAKPEDRQITLQQGSTPSRTIIRRTKPQDSVRMLGVHLNPMGDFTDHLQVQQKKADNYAMKLASPKLTATDIRIFHRSIYIPSMRYSLPTIAVNEEDLQSVQSRVIQVMLQRLHVSSTIPTSIRHGPIELGGLGLYDLRTEVGVEAIKFFRNAIYSDSETGNLLRINLQYSQLEAGIGNPLLEFPNQYIPYLTPTWVLSLRQYMSRHNITIKLTEDYTPQLTVKHDQYIMQQQHLSRYTESQQRDINCVRMHLQVIRMSDMVNLEKPNTLQLEYIDATRPDTWTDDSRWPRQEFLTASQRRLWKRYIQSSFLRYLPYLKDPPDLNAPSALHPPIDTNRALATEYPNLKEYVRSLPKSQRRMLTDLEQVSDDITVWRAFRSKARLYVASDGGLKGHPGPSAGYWQVRNRCCLNLQARLTGLMTRLPPHAASYVDVHLRYFWWSVCLGFGAFDIGAPSGGTPTAVLQSLVLPSILDGILDESSCQTITTCCHLSRG